MLQPGQYFYDLVHNPYVHVAKLDGAIEGSDRILWLEYVGQESLELELLPVQHL